MKKWQKFFIWFAWCIVFVLACELANYWSDYNLLNSWRLDLIEILFLILGTVSAYLAPKKNKKKKN